MKRENFLDYVPRHNVLFPFECNAQQRVTIQVTHKGLFHRFAQIFAHRTRVSYVELDEFGSFVWLHIDGARSVYEIGKLVHERFGDAAEPLYGRLSKFIATLRANHYIVYANKIKKDAKKQG